MAETSGKEYWLYKEIEEEFRQSVDPWLLFKHVKEFATKKDVRRFEEAFEKTMLQEDKTNKEVVALWLFDRLTKYPDWIDILLKTTELPDLGLKKLAKLLKDMETYAKGSYHIGDLQKGDAKGSYHIGDLQKGDTTDISGASTNIQNASENFARICQLMMTVCVDLFRDILDYYIQPQELQSEIYEIYEYLKSIMNREQYTLLYRYVDRRKNTPPLVTKDLSLLYIMIRFTCNTPQPEMGWGCRPKRDDESLAGYVERIRVIGVEILDQSNKAEEIHDPEFKDILKNLRSIIQEIQTMVLKKDRYTQAVDELFSREFKLSNTKRYIQEFQKLQNVKDPAGPFAVIEFYPERDIENVFRVSTLICTISYNLFRDTLCHFVNPGSLHFNEDTKRAVKDVRIISRQPWSSEDIGLLFCYNLLRNNCGISQHKNGWGFRPEIDDHSLAACIDRIMIQRNEMICSTKSGLSESAFREIWCKCRDDIIKIEQHVIGGNVYEQRVHDLLSMPIKQQIALNYVVEKVRKMSYWVLSTDDVRKEGSSFSIKTDGRNTGVDSQSMSVSAIQHDELFSLISTTVRETFPSDSFGGEILDKKGITPIVNKINALSKEVPVIRNPEIYQRTKGFEPGAVIIFEVEVTLNAGELEDKASEKKIENTLSAENFFSSRRDYNPRVILVKSDPALKEYAKSFVFRKHKDVISMGNTFVQHENEDTSELSKLSGFYSVSFVCDQIQSMIEILRSYDCILQSFLSFFTKQMIFLVCSGINLEKHKIDARSVESVSYYCNSESSLNQLKRNLELKTIENICTSLGFYICQTLGNIDFKFDRSGSFCHDMRGLPADIPAKILFEAIKENLPNEIGSSSAKVTFPVDVNSNEWRKDVAVALYTLLHDKRFNIKKLFVKLCLETLSSLESVCTQLESYKSRCHQSSITEYVSRSFPLTATWFQQSLGPKLCIIEQIPIQTDLGWNLLDAISFKKELGIIRSMAWAKKEEILKSGFLHILEADVLLEDSIYVVKTNASEEDNFFSSDSDKIARVIWIHSESVIVIEAMLCVYKQYESKLKYKNILLHHESDENVDEIRQLIVIQKLNALYKTFTLISSAFPYHAYPELQEAIDETLSEQNIQTTCDAVILQSDRFWGTVENKMKWICSEKIMESFCLQICQRIIKCIEKGTKKENETYKVTFTKIPQCNIQSLTPFFPSFKERISSSLENMSKEITKKEIAHVFRDILNQNSIEIGNQLLKMCRSTKDILPSLLDCIIYLRYVFAFSDQDKVVEKWTKRDVIKDRKDLFSKFPSLLTLIAGERKGTSIVEVFLQENNEKTKVSDYLKKSCNISTEVEFYSPDVSERQTEVKTLKEIRRNMTMNPLSEVERHTMGDMRRIVQIHEDILLANHSNLVGIGVSRMNVDDSRFGKPCIVLHCLDKTMLPFGESILPKFIEGYPVEVQENLYTFAFCENCAQLLNCPPVDYNCSIGRRLSQKSAGSVGFFVRKRSKLQEGGFLTNAHVAMSPRNLADLYGSKTLFSNLCFEADAGEYDIVHPSIADAGARGTTIGSVGKAFFGNFTTTQNGDRQTIGMDTAYIRFSSEIPADLEGNNKTFQNVNEPYDEILERRVTKTGRSTGTTTGMLSEIGTFKVLFCGNFIKFKNCFQIDDIDGSFGEEGDSGSGVFLEEKERHEKKALGILFATAKDSQNTLVCDVKKFLELCDLELFHPT